MLPQTLTHNLLPYGISTLSTFVATSLENHRHITGLSAVLLAWAAENGSYYLTLYCCDFFSATAEKTFGEGRESLKQLFLIETLDAVVRWLLLGLAILLPNHQALAAAAASLLADVSFAVSLQKSRRLLELYRECRKRWINPEFVTIFSASQTT